MSAYDTIIGWTRGKTGWMADMIAFATKTRDDIAALVASGVTASLAYEAREVSSAVDITLVAADSVLQSVTMTAASKAVILPDATTCVEGRPRVITNAGSNDFAIKKNGGSVLVAAVAAGATYQVTLVDGATAAGEWHSLQAGPNIVQGKHTQSIPAASWRPTESNGCAGVEGTETTAGHPDIVGLAFDASADEHAQVTIPMLDSWDGGTIEFQPFWESTATDTDGVAWALQGVCMGDGDTFDVPYGTAVVVTDAAQSTAEDCYIGAWSSAVTIAAAASGELMTLRIFRDVSDANDDMTEDATLVAVKIRYIINAGDDS